MELQRHAWCQSNLYRNAYRLTVRMLFVLCCTTLILVCAIVWFLLFSTDAQTYYATMIDGQVIMLKPEKKSV